MIYIINIAENSNTKRGQRHVNLFKAIKKIDASEVVYISSNFDHGSKRHIPVNNTSDEIFFRIPGYGSNLSLMRQINHIIFSLKVLSYLSFSCNENDIIITSSIPAELPFAAAILRKIFHIRMIIDVRDIWPDAFPTPGFKNVLFSKYVNFLNRYSFTKADKMIISNRDFEPFVKSYNCCSEYVPLGYDNNRFTTISSENCLRQGCVYLGNLNASFDLTTLSHFCQKRDISIFGEGDLKQNYIDTFGATTLKGFIDYERVPAELVKYKYGLLPITGTATLPNKLYDYIASGLAIVTNDLSFARKICLDESRIEVIDHAFVIQHSNCNSDFMIDYADVSQQILRIANHE